MANWRCLGSILLTTALAASACQPTASSSPTTNEQRTSAEAVAQKMVWAYAFPPVAAWALESDDARRLSDLGVTEAMAKIGYDGKIGPNLAVSWAQTSALTWEFTLRDGVQFQDGTALDAATAASALTHLLQAKAPARIFSRKTFAAVDAVGTKVVRITTTAANPLVPLYLASANTAILARSAYLGTALNPLGTGTGPFIITRDNQPQSVTLKANPNYWGGTVGLSDAEVRFIPDGNTRVTQLRTGEAQLISPVPITSLASLKADSNVRVVTQSLARTTAMYMNNAKAPFIDVRVRQAIQSAIDVKSLATDLLEGAVTPASGPFAATAPWSPTGAQPVAYDTAKALSLFAQAGIDPKTLTLQLWAYPQRAELPSVAVAIQAMLKKIGIAVNIRIALSLDDEALAGNFDMYLVSRGYTQDINDPAGYFQADYSCAGTYALSHFCTAAFDAQIAKAVATADTETRYALYGDLAAQLQMNAVDVFLYNDTEIDAHSVTLQGYRIHPQNDYVLTRDLTIKGK